MSDEATVAPMRPIGARPQPSSRGPGPGASTGRTASRAGAGRGPASTTSGGGRAGGRHLFSATVSHVSRTGAYAVFHATLAFSEQEFRSALRLILGEDVEGFANVGRGIVWDPISRSLVTEDVRTFLRRVEATPDPTAMTQIHVWLEQRLG